MGAYSNFWLVKNAASKYSDTLLIEYFLEIVNCTVFEINYCDNQKRHFEFDSNYIKSVYRTGSDLRGPLRGRKLRKGQGREVVDGTRK